MSLIEISLKNAIKDACYKLFDTDVSDFVMVEMLRDPSLGDYSTNIARRITNL